MEDITARPTARWALLTAIAPIAWGTTYWVTREHLPADHPLYGAILRGLPAGALLLLVARRLPSGAWWWRAPVLGTLNTGAFFALVYVAAQLLPSSVAATIMATAPITMMLVAWALLADRPHAIALVAGVLGVVGVGLLVFAGPAGVDVRGVLASVAAMALSSLGYVLATRWGRDVDVLASTSWQLVGGALVLVPFAVLIEGAPPRLDGGAVLGFAYLTVVATAIAFAVWFTGLRRLGAGATGLVGLLNPVTGVALGVLVAGETLGWRQVGGLALIAAAIVLGQPATVRRVRALTARRRAAGIVSRGDIALSAR